MKFISDNLPLFGMLCLGLVVGALAMLVPLFLTGYGFFSQFATKKEMGELERRMSKEISDNRSSNEHQFGELKAKFDALNATIQLATNDNSRVIGLMEGKLELMQHMAHTKLEASA